MVREQLERVRREMEQGTWQGPALPLFPPHGPKLQDGVHETPNHLTRLRVATNVPPVTPERTEHTMSYVYPDVTINDEALREIDPERFTNNLIDDDGEISINVDLNGDSTIYVCAKCGTAVDGDGEPEDASEDRCPRHPDENGEPKPAPHIATVAPLGWINKIKIQTDPGKDQAHVLISVGDPRGAFEMRVERIEGEDDDGRPFAEYRLSVPHPDESGGHEPLTQLNSAGYYRIGERTYRD